MYRQMRPTVVIHLAAVVGGIGANREHPGSFFYANMAMGLHLIEHARRGGTEEVRPGGHDLRLSQVHARPLPARTTCGTAIPEETNAPYGIAKKALLVMLQAYRQRIRPQRRSTCCR